MPAIRTLRPASSRDGRERQAGRWVRRTSSAMSSVSIDKTNQAVRMYSIQ